MSHPLIPHLLAYLQDPEPELRDHADVEAALADPEQRKALLEALADVDPIEDPPEVLQARALTGALAWWHDWLDGNGIKVNTVHDDLQGFSKLRTAVASGDDPIRATGQRHSDSAVCRPALDATVIDLRGWQKTLMSPLPTPNEVQTDGTSIQVRVFGFEKLRNVMDRLKSAGLALVNTGSYTGQTIAGPFSMGTHGSGPDLGAMPDGVTAVDILGADGKVRRVRSAKCLFPASETVTLPRGKGSYDAEGHEGVSLNAAVVSLGTFGVVLSYILEVREEYFLRQEVTKSGWLQALADARARIDGPEGERPRHIEIMLRPDKRDGNNALLFERSLDDPSVGQEPGGVSWVSDFFGQGSVNKTLGRLVSKSKPLRGLMFDAVFGNQEGLDGTRGIWDKILVRDTGVKAHGFEVFFPYAYFEQGVDAVLDGVDAAAADKAFVTAPMGVRFVKAGSHWLSMTHRRYRVGDRVMTTDRWVTVEVPRMIGTRNQKLVPEHVLAKLTERGIPHRPHWGQYFPTDKVDTTKLYPRLAKWRTARTTFGADARFLTPTLAKVTGLSHPTPRQLLGDAGVPGVGRKVLVLLGDTAADPQRRDAIRADLERAADQLRTPRPIARFMAFDDVLIAEEAGDDVDVLKAALHGELGNLFRYRSGRTAARGWLDEVEHWEGFDPQRLVRWLSNPTQRETLRDRFEFLLASFHPDMVVAHGVGGLVAYDALSWKTAGEPPKVDLVTLGTPVGHQAFRSFWGGVVRHPPHRVGRWFHLHNPEDPVFAAPMPVPTVRGLTLRTASGETPHAAATYLGHGRLLEEVWRPLFTEKAPVSVTFRTQVRTASSRKRKALLVGVDRYAGAGMDLEGCVNDVFAVSQVMQKRFDYQTGDVRLLTNERATADALRERLEWLLADAVAGDHRVLYFSGHGARLPSYNALEVVDQVDECLVMHDFDWDRPGSAFVDDEFAAFYSQLPFGVRFTAIFDCCHGGGMSRSSAARVRGLTPPDDIRHRMLAYQSGWQDRFAAATSDRLARVKREAGPLRVGTLGAGLAVRPDRVAYEQARESRGQPGPFMPLLAYACAEGELSFEHQVGATVHGAFTWTLLQKLNRSKLPSFQRLVEKRVRPAVRKLGYAQTAEVSGPTARLKEPFSL